ncbi:hypothetical protein [uncultured Shewanella sp.]|uniref:hypothetical protein n=1 Tax=uncultured Shewanella sp. TaxID=173975 RepID=UPI0026182825|nr:hypothetical protein [uncultured Shewanella sp.]
MEIKTKEFPLKRYLSQLLLGMLGVLGASNADSTSIATAPNVPYAGYELISRTVLSDERSCETITQTKLDLDYSSMIDDIYRQQREQKQLSFDQSTAQLQLTTSQLETFTHDRLEQTQALLLAYQHLEQLQEATALAKQLYRECTLDDCSAEYEHYKNLREREREYEQDTVNPLETLIADLDRNIEQLEGEIEKLEDDIDELAQFLAQADAAAADLSEKQALYAATFESRGELTQLKAYGDIQAFDFVSSARLLLHRGQAYDSVNGVPIGILTSIETLATPLIGNIMPTGAFEWPLTNDTQNIATALHALLNESVTTDLYVDEHYTCAISREGDTEAFIPTFSLMLNVVEDKSLLNEYRISVDPQLAVDELATLIKGVAYLPTSSLARFSFSESAFLVESVTVLDEAEADLMPELLARDFLHALLERFAVPAPDMESAQCTSQITSSGCQLAGWWFNGLNAKDLPNVAISPYTIELSDTIKLSERIFLSMAKNAALP